MVYETPGMLQVFQVATMLVPYNCATTEDSSPVAVGYFEAVENSFVAAVDNFVLVEDSSVFAVAAYIVHIVEL